MKLFSWLKGSSHAIKEAKEERRLNRGAVATKLTQLDEHRHVLDEMVKRSLELLETKK